MNKRLGLFKKYAPSITSVISEFDASTLVGCPYDEYCKDGVHKTAVTSGHDFIYNGVRYQVKACRPSGKKGSKITKDLTFKGANPMNLEKAILIATTAHQGQTDKAGAPYIFHPLRIMLSCKTEDEQICAVLHDVIEDTAVTLEDLRTAGFKEEIIDALSALTKHKNETYDDFINRVIQNQLACRVKLADISDNMNLSRIPNPSQEDYQRVEKYSRAADKIVNSLAAFTDDSYITSKEILKITTPNEVTVAAFEEGERMLNDPSATRFSSVESLFEDLNS